MFRVNMNENVTIHKAPERQAAVQGKLSTGRVVGQNPVTAWTPGQMAGASSTSWRAIPPHSETVHSRAVKRTADFSTEAASAKRPKGPETTTQPWQFKEQVDDAVRQLHKKRENAPDDLSFCLAVIDTDTALSCNLDSMKADMTSDDYNSCLQHSISAMSVLYNASLDNVLNFFQHQVANEQCWIYIRALDKVTRSFGKLGCKSAAAARNTTMLATIWKLYLNKELDYLQYLKKFPGDNSYPAQCAVDNINWLISAWPPAHNFGLLNNESRNKIKEDANSLYQEIIHSDTSHSDAGKKKENVLHKATDFMMEKRRYHDLIHGKLDILHNDYKTACGLDRAQIHRIHYLEELLKLYEEYHKLVDNPHTPLFGKLDRVLTQIVNNVRSKLKRGDYDYNRVLKEEISSLISHLEKEKLLNRAHENLYSGFMKLQSTVIPAIRGNTMTYGQIHTALNSISSVCHSEGHNRDDELIALKQFKRLFDNCGDKLDKTKKNKKADGIRRRITTVRKIFFARLFAPLLADYRNHYGNTRQAMEQICAIMHCHKDKIIELNQYTSCVFIPDNDKPKSAWQNAACFAWLDDLKRLCRQTSFNRDDVNNLLDLKDVAPDMPSYKVRSYLINTLIRLFQFMLQTNPDAVLVEKVTELSEWTDNFDQPNHKFNDLSHDIYQRLHKSNKQWREKYVSAGERATTSSSTSAARMPSSVPPGTLSVFPETFDCHSRMRLQDVPHAGQFSIPGPAVPTPAPFGAFQQSGSSIPCRAPIAQSVAGSRPFPPSWFGWPVLPCMPVPAYSWAGFHQPTSTGLWTDPAVAAAGTSQQQHEPRRSAMPFEYWSEYPSSSNTR